MPKPSTEIPTVLQKKEIDLTHYESKLRELEDHQHTAGSQPLRDWIILAKAETAQAMDHLREMNKLIFDFLTAYDYQTRQWIAELIQQRDQHQARLIEFSGARIMVSLRESLTHYYEHALEMVILQIKEETDAYGRVTAQYPLCLDEFCRVLLDLIFRPDQGSFHYKSAIETLKRLGSGLLPGLEEFEKFNIALPTIKTRTFPRPEDKTELYIQQYRDAIRQWENLGSVYLHIVNN